MPKPNPQPTILSPDSIPRLDPEVKPTRIVPRPGWNARGSPMNTFTVTHVHDRKGLAPLRLQLTKSANECQSRPTPPLRNGDTGATSSAPPSPYGANGPAPRASPSVNADIGAAPSAPPSPYGPNGPAPRAPPSVNGEIGAAPSPPPSPYGENGPPLFATRR